MGKRHRNSSPDRDSLSHKKRRQSESDLSHPSLPAKHRESNSIEPKRRHSCHSYSYSSSSDSSDSSDSSCISSELSDCDGEKRRSAVKKSKKHSKKSKKQAEEKLKRRKAKKEKKRKKKKKKKERRKSDSRESTKKSEVGPVAAHASGISSAVAVTKAEKPVATSTAMAAHRVKAPMTKAEWEKQQSVIRRVHDPTTGRDRLIKGDGEILEEIVTKDRHKDINKRATLTDGLFYQSQAHLYQ